MTELATRGSADVAPHTATPGSPSTVHALVQWAESASAAHRIAQSLVETSFVPQAFRGKPHEATAAILAGAEVGLSPMAALRSFDVIQGQAAPRAITLRAVVQSAGHEVYVKESTESRAVVAGRRRGSDQEQRSTWTLDRAWNLGLTGKDNWKKQPGAMLLARATAEVCRLIASDAILGIGYSIEEVEDSVPAPTVAVSRADGGRRTARRAPVTPPPAPPEPDFDEPPSPSAAEQDTGEVITAAQLKKLHAAMNQQGLSDRAEGLAFLSVELGRGITSSKELTKAEASQVIDRLEQTPLGAEPIDEPAWPPTAQPPDAS